MDITISNGHTSSPFSIPSSQHLLGHGLLPGIRAQHFLCLGRRAFLACGKGFCDIKGEEAKTRPPETLKCSKSKMYRARRPVYLIR